MLSDQGYECEDAGHIRPATNNSMELLAIIKGLEALERDSHVYVYSDSAYVVNAMNNGWWKDWKDNNWKKRNGAPTPNAKLWKRLVHLCRRHDIEFIKVKGHSGDTLNDRCDKLAKEARKLGSFNWNMDVDEEDGSSTT